MTPLEILFHRISFEYDDHIQRLARRHRYPMPRAIRWRQMAANDPRGAVGAAKQLMLSPTAQSGFTELWLFGNTIGQDLIGKYSVEATMLEERFRILFEDDELIEAQRRIDAHRR